MLSRAALSSSAGRFLLGLTEDCLDRFSASAVPYRMGQQVLYCGEHFS